MRFFSQKGSFLTHTCLFKWKNANGKLSETDINLMKFSFVTKIIIRFVFSKRKFSYTYMFIQWTNANGKFSETLTLKSNEIHKATYKTKFSETLTLKSNKIHKATDKTKIKWNFENIQKNSNNLMFALKCPAFCLYYFNNQRRHWNIDRLNANTKGI